MNTWNEIMANWVYVLPPSRPSKIELERIRIVSTRYNHEEPVAVLGSTIEYRDLLYEIGFKQVYVFEKNLEYHDSVGRWKIYECKNEFLVEGDWLNTLRNYKGMFNIILSDLTMGNINYDNRNAFYTDISIALKPGGVFIDKVLTHSENLITIDEIENKYNNMPVNILTANMFSCEALFCSELLKSGVVDTTKFYSVLRDKYKNNNRLLRIVDMSHLISPENCIWYYGKPWQELEKDYHVHFKSHIYFDDEINSPYYGRLKHFINYGRNRYE